MHPADFLDAASPTDVIERLTFNSSVLAALSVIVTEDQMRQALASVTSWPRA